MASVKFLNLLRQLRCGYVYTCYLQCHSNDALQISQDLIFVNESDCHFRTIDDFSEVSNNWTIYNIDLNEPKEPSIKLRNIMLKRTKDK